MKASPTQTGAERLPARRSLLARTRLPIDAYWLFIGAFFLVSIAFFIYHLSTGFMPGRAAFRISAFNLEIFWYGIIIVGGVALGAAVTATLAHQRARRIFTATVPLVVRSQALTATSMPSKLRSRLLKKKVISMGDLLFEWGLHPGRLGLKKGELRSIAEFLAAADDVQEEWLQDAPWRPWNPDYVWAGVGWCLVLGVIGARLYHVFTPSPSLQAQGIFSAADYFRQPVQLINLRSGGLGIYGGLIGGATGLLWFTRRNRLPAFGWADLAVVGVALGQYVGRWGNFLNQELYGRPTQLPWGIRIDPVHRISPYHDLVAFPPETRFQPAFLYESLWSLAAFLALLFVLRRYRAGLRQGDLVALYLLFYGVGRILLELVRLDSRAINLGFAELPVATVVSLAIILAAVAFMVGRRRLSR